MYSQLIGATLAATQLVIMKFHLRFSDALSAID